MNLRLEFQILPLGSVDSNSLASKNHKNGSSLSLSLSADGRMKK